MIAKTGLGSIVFLVTIVAAIDATAATFNVSDFGAAGDKQSKDTAAIQAAIDRCAEAGGGVVLVPAGDYLCGALRLASRVTLYLDAGATIWSSREPGDYEDVGRCLLNGEGLQDVAVVGFGTLYGIGEADLGRKPESSGKDQWPDFRAGILRLEECRNIELRSFKILMSDTWTVHFRHCDNVLVDGLTILNNYYHTNSDGIDPVSCRNVRISNCHIVAGDDCIVLKTADGRACENVVVTNCTLETVATALKLGTESSGDFRNVHFSNCSIRNSTVGIGMYLKDGATMERISFSNIDVETPRPSGITNLEKSVYPVFVDVERRNPDSKIGTIRDLSFDHLQITSGVGVLIQGMPESPIENLSFTNVAFRVEAPADYGERKKHVGGRRTTRDERDTLFVRKPSYVTLAHVDGLVVENLRLQASPEDFRRQERSALAVFESTAGVIRNVFRQQPGSADSPPVILLENCRNMLVGGSVASPGTASVVGLAGEKTAGIAIDKLGMHAAAAAVTLSEDVPAAALEE